ncbi:APC family permease [Stygiolobus caldivivus]|uniref:Amino acid transporter n=1 Tax=Stygiolobus caldivivus TaxID=2824673 RepID=A0A8D5U5B3_9CREN|nr:APC family permease [Stygiolobus caldivivus]BCU69353.1 amino acid transporter [Stygiolobus caldivivus]
MTQENKSLFLRESSGLVREVSPWASMSATFGLVTGGVPILILSWLFTAPGANWILSFLLMLPATLGMAFLFYVAGVSMPRAGGDYVFNSRAVHPAVGFVNYWGLFIGFALSLGYYSYLAAQWFAYLFSGIGLAYNNSYFLSIGNFLGTTEAEVLLGTVVVIMSTLLGVFTRFQWKFVLYGGLISLITSVVMFGALATIHPANFATALAQNTGVPNAYNEVINDATSNGLSFYPAAYATVLAGPVVWYYYTWYNLPASWSGEMKKPKLNILYATIVSILLIAIYYIVFTYLNLNAFGYKFLTAWSYISNNGVNDTVYNDLQSIGTFTPYFAFIVTHSLPLFIIMFIALWLPNFYSNPPLVVALVRYLFAWSFDRLMPSWLADVNDRVKAPVKATILVGILGELGVLLYAFNTPIAIVDTTVVFEIGYAVFALSIALMPFVRKNLFKNAVMYRQSIGKMPIVSVIGFSIFAFLVYILSITWGNPILLPVNFPTLLSLAIIYASGAMIYFASYIYNKSRGIDLSILFEEIPPE